MVLKKGQSVRVKPHIIYDDLRGGAVHSIMHKHQHEGYAHASIIALFEDGSAEISIKDGYDVDVVPIEALEPLE